MIRQGIHFVSRNCPKLGLDYAETLRFYEGGIGMKRLFCLLMSIILLCAMTSSCKTQKSATPLEYKTYDIDGVKFLPSFSSSSPDYFLEQNIGTLFIVGMKTFDADISNAVAPSVKEAAFKHVGYIQEALDGSISAMGKDVGSIDISAYHETTSYKVMVNAEDTGFRIYYLDKDVWIGHFSWYGEKKDVWWADYIFSVKLHDNNK